MNETRKCASRKWLKIGLGAVCLAATCVAPAQTAARARQAAHATYQNPILFADYSDPDVIREGPNYYLIASTFEFVPAIPILQSTDLVHWTILGHVVQRLSMDPRYNMIGGNRYGQGVWAPAIRRHKGFFYVYFPTPGEGIFVSRARKITGPWTPPVAVIAKSGLEDPCPFWDDDGKAYLIHSRTGAGPLILHRMSPDGMRVLDQGKVIVDDHAKLPVLEGPKLYKRNGYYYIFAPFGGVGGGSQAVLRSRSIYGPYESRVVLTQGDTPINGPHQGAYVESPDGAGWFVHFQLDGAHGRIVHLEPVRWKDNWPIVGSDPDGDSPGQPVASGPIHGHSDPVADQHPQTSDEFTGAKLRPQWEWNHNPDDAHWSLSARPGFLRLIPMPADGLLAARNTITESMQDNAFVFTSRIDLGGMRDGTRAGLAMFERSPSGVEVIRSDHQRQLAYFQSDRLTMGPTVSQAIVQFRIQVQGNEASYFYSLDNGQSFHPLGPVTPIQFSWWKGARPSLFAYTTSEADQGAGLGAVDFDWVHYQPLGKNPW